MPPVMKDTPRSSARKRKQVSYKEIEDEAGFDIVKSLVSNDGSNGKAPQFGAYPGRLGGAGMNISPMMANQG